MSSGLTGIRFATGIRKKAAFAGVFEKPANSVFSVLTIIVLNVLSV
jgi:hypothetical protein